MNEASCPVHHFLPPAFSAPPDLAAGHPSTRTPCRDSHGTSPEMSGSHPAAAHSHALPGSTLLSMCRLGPPMPLSAFQADYGHAQMLCALPRPPLTFYVTYLYPCGHSQPP